MSQESLFLLAGEYICVLYNVLIFSALGVLRSVGFPTLNILMCCGIGTYVIRHAVQESLNDF